jgi:hypothetical protein
MGDAARRRPPRNVRVTFIGNARPPIFVHEWDPRIQAKMGFGTYFGYAPPRLKWEASSCKARFEDESITRVWKLDFEHTWGRIWEPDEPTVRVAHIEMLREIEYQNPGTWRDPVRVEGDGSRCWSQVVEEFEVPQGRGDGYLRPKFNLAAHMPKGWGKERWRTPPPGRKCALQVKFMRRRVEEEVHFHFDDEGLTHSEMRRPVFHTEVVLVEAAIQGTVRAAALTLMHMYFSFVRRESLLWIEKGRCSWHTARQTALEERGGRSARAYEFHL